MNPIETQWWQLKCYEMAGQMSGNAYDLTMRVMEGMGVRRRAEDYPLERFMLKCA